MRRLQRPGRKAQMAVEMALLIPVYFFFMFAVFVYSDWFRVVSALDASSVALTRGEGVFDANDVDPALQPMEAFGTLQTTQEPAFGDEDGSGPLGLGAIGDLTSMKLLVGGGKCDESSTGFDSASTEIALMAFLMDRGVRRSSSPSRVSFRYDNHNYWDMYDRSAFKPMPMLISSSGGTHPRVTMDKTRQNGKWYGHPIEGLGAILMPGFEFDMARYGLIGTVGAKSYLTPNPYYMRHLGWLGYDWSAFTEPTPAIDGVNPINPCTYHPHLTIDDSINYLHMNPITKLGF